MADAEYIVEVMRELIEYYRYELSAKGLLVYARLLKDMDEWVLRQVVDEWILSERFFPRVSELRDRARRIEGSGCEFLFQEAESLKLAFLKDGIMNPAAWERVARNFDNLDETELGCWVRETQRRLVESCDEHGNATPAARQRYLEWESLSVDGDSLVEQERPL